MFYDISTAIDYISTYSDILLVANFYCDMEKCQWTHYVTCYNYNFQYSYICMHIVCAQTKLLRNNVMSQRLCYWNLNSYSQETNYHKPHYSWLTICNSFEHIAIPNVLHVCSFRSEGGMIYYSFVALLFSSVSVNCCFSFFLSVYSFWETTYLYNPFNLNSIERFIWAYCNFLWPVQVIYWF